MIVHYARFARAIALVSSGMVTGCYQAHERVDPHAPIDAAVTDAGPRTCTSPLPCTCPTLSSDGNCNAVGLIHCCPIVGPLAPPDLPT